MQGVMLHVHSCLIRLYVLYILISVFDALICVLIYSNAVHICNVFHYILARAGPNSQEGPRLGLDPGRVQAQAGPVDFMYIQATLQNNITYSKVPNNRTAVRVIRYPGTPTIQKNK